jgi:hypothetical protein
MSTGVELDSLADERLREVSRVLFGITIAGKKVAIQVDENGQLGLSVGSVTISDVGISGPLGDKAKAASISVTPATDVPTTRDIGRVNSTAEGTTTDAVASVSADEDGTARTSIGLYKAMKNLLIDISGFLSTLAGSVTSSKIQADVKTLPTNIPDTAGGNLAAIGTTADAAASVSADEDTTVKTSISLLKGAKNLLIDISGFLSTLAGAVSSSKIQVDVATCASHAVTLATLPDTSATDLAHIHAAAEMIIKTVPTLYNVILTLARTEYSQALPANTKAYSFQSLGGKQLWYAFATGKVATPTAPYYIVAGGAEESENNLNLAAITLYFATADAGDTILLKVWT